MKERTSHRRAYLAGTSAALLAGVVGISLLFGGDQSGVVSGAGSDAPVEPVAAQDSPQSLPDMAEFSATLEEIELTLSERSAQLKDLENLIEIRRTELEQLEVLLAEKGIELQEIMAALRSADYAALVHLDEKMGAFGDAMDDPLRTTVQSGANDGGAEGPALSADVRKIGEIIHKARIEANPNAPSTTESMLVEILFEVGSSDLTIGGQTRAMVAAQAITEMQLQAVRIEAHSDTVGPSDVNDRLSVARAQAVARIFHQAGVPESAIQIVAMGEDPGGLPVATPDGTSEPLNRIVGVYPISLTN